MYTVYLNDVAEQETIKQRQNKKMQNEIGERKMNERMVCAAVLTKPFV